MPFLQVEHKSLGLLRYEGGAQCCVMCSRGKAIKNISPSNGTYHCSTCNIEFRVEGRTQSGIDPPVA
jgi:hypothetical protein